MKSKREKSGKKQALTADRHELYQKSVQDADMEVALMLEKYREIRGNEPVHFREDFCGTALLSTTWCKGSADRTALGVDLCQDTLEWGRIHNVEPAGKEVQDRVKLVHANVLDVTTPKVDMTCALNFSYCVFKDRDALRRYFAAAHEGLNSNGVLLLDIYGGPESMGVLKEDRKVKGDDGKFTFIWEQEKFNPISNEILCHIHFKFPDGSRIRNAFTYDWRLWSLPELQELLLEAGFSRVHVYWEEYVDDDKDSEYLTATGNYVEVTEVENQDAWIAYLFAEV